jgi:signal transduction histidine kinase
MSIDQHALSHRRQARIILIGGAFVVLLSLIFGANIISRFTEAESTWESHNARATAIADALAEFNRQTGYGGFIHNFKNLVLRRDLLRYQEKIEANIAGFRAALDHLDALLKVEGDRAAIAQMRATFEEYATKYAYVEPMVVAGASSDEIDAVVKVNDGPALKAMAQLSTQVAVRAKEAELLAQRTQADALRFVWSGGLLVLAAIIVATVAMMLFLRRIVAANEIIRKTQARVEAALTRQQEMQDELVQAEKLAALGGLVAGVAHEINTPVGITLSAATHLEAETQKTDRTYQAGELTEEGLAEYFATARQAAQLMTLNSQRAADLIQGFKQVAVDQTGSEQRCFDLATYIDEVLLSLRPRLRKTRIEITVDCPAELTLDSLPGAFSQVLTNLIMNSLVHAFEPDQTGHIHITANLEGDDQVRLIYRDDGRGIPPELHAKVFEPFFTTRRSKGGSGLGLHIVHTIVTQSLKGSITLASLPGQGIEFTLRLPRILQSSLRIVSP